MNWLFEPFQHEFMQRALLGCALVGFTNGFLSAFIVLRRMALMADALSHSLLPGLAVGVMLFGLASSASLFCGALVAALLVALGSQLIARSSRVKEETALAVLFTLAFAAGIVLLKFARVQVELNHYLFGNILGLSNSDLWTTYGISFVTLPLLVLLQRPLFLMLFEPSVARTQGVPVAFLNYLLVTLLVLAMISSLQAVGVILALGLLVAPAATVYLFSDSCAALFWGGGLVGLFGSCTGLLVSYWLNLPAGACIVLLLGLMFFAAYLFSPKYGVLHRFIHGRHLHGESLARWQDSQGHHH
ncbi:MAG: metal ABC transporter permease [Methylacidiphilales bacterium]|nr:metal ABC transporter permease [Candidatus Methylacidiphilales bacterium]